MFASSFRGLASAGLLGLVTLGLPEPAAAQGWIEPRHPNFAVERIRSDVRITVDAGRRIAHIEVEEQFRNQSGALLEGDYLYPIPSGSAFTDFSLFMGAREMKGEILPAEKARGIYEEIVRRRKDPALIELVGHGVLRARVFPVGPGETRRVILRYTQVLERDGDLVRVRYPRVVGIVPGTENVEQVTQRPLEQHPFNLTILVNDADRFATPYSPTHTIEVRPRTGGAVQIVHESDAGTASRDFELFLPMRRTFVGASVVAHAISGEPGFFMLLLSPPATPLAEEIPRDLTLVVDVSGSMAGEKMDQAKAALEQILGGLRSRDRFRLITFHNVIREFREGFTTASAANVRAAREYVSDLRAEGGTNIHDALRLALEGAADAERMSLVLFVTDGKPTAGETAPERIAELAERLRDGERVFAFGVGYDVNTYLLDRLVQRGRGTVSYVRPGDDLEVAVASLTTKIDRPALSDLRIVQAPAELEDFYPSPLPDLFYGQELLVFGRYRGEGNGVLVLEGSRAGKSERLRYEVTFPRREPGNEFIPKLWASRKVGALSAQVRLNGPDPELVNEIRELGLRYGILTEYTSYLVEEPELALSRDEAELSQLRARELAAPAADQVGAAHFRRAEASRQLQDASKVVYLEEVVVTGGARPASRHAGDRYFVLKDGVWTDVGFDHSLRVIKVEPFSPAYFELVRRLPALKAHLALGERVLISGDGLALEIGPGGITQWEPDDLRAVLRGLRNIGGA